MIKTAVGDFVQALSELPPDTESYYRFVTASDGAFAAATYSYLTDKHNDLYSHVLRKKGAPEDAGFFVHKRTEQMQTLLVCGASLYFYDVMNGKDLINSEKTTSAREKLCEALRSAGGQSLQVTALPHELDYDEINFNRDLIGR